MSTDTTSPDRTAAAAAGVDDDRRVVADAVARVGPPRPGAPDSFRLHAPLEVLARAALLPRVAPEHRSAARARLARVADDLDAVGAPVATGPAPLQGGTEEAAARLVAAIADGDPDAADAHVQALAPLAGPERVVAALAPVALPSLAGAGHGVIALRSLLTHGTGLPGAVALLRGPVRELARQPDAAITWHRSHPVDGPAGSATALEAALAAPPSPGDPGSTFVWPTVALVERSGLAADRLADATRGLSVADARRALLRTAARAMLQDDPIHAPYGWTHALTLPQGALALAPWAGPDDVVAVAATYVLAFRATLGSVELDPAWAPDRPSTPATPHGLLADGPAAAAAGMWHAEPDRRPALVTAVATAAAVGEDAHLTKYVLSCLEAAEDDPPAAPLFWAAAASLAGWWATGG